MDWLNVMLIVINFFDITLVLWGITLFSVVDPECVFDFDWNTRPSETREVFFQETSLLLGPEEDAEMRSEANSEWPGVVWLRTEYRSCCPTRCLAIVTQFAHFCFRAVLKMRLFLTPETTEKLLYGFFLVEKKVLYWSVQCWKVGKLSCSGGGYNVCMCMYVVVYNNLNRFCLLYSSKFFFSIKFFFLFKIVTYQSIFTMIYYLYFISKMSKCYKF